METTATSIGNKMSKRIKTVKILNWSRFRARMSVLLIGKKAYQTRSPYVQAGTPRSLERPRTRPPIDIAISY